MVRGSGFRRDEQRGMRTKRCTPSCGGLFFTLYSVARRNRVIVVVRIDRLVRRVRVNARSSGDAVLLLRLGLSLHDRSRR